MRKITNLFIIVCLTVLLVPSMVSAVGLGISPSVVEVDTLVRGMQFEKEVMLSRSEASEALSFAVKGEGDIAQWVSTEFGDSFTIPAGQQRFPVTVYVKVPEDAANGEYSGNVRFNAQPGEAREGSGNDVAVLVSAVLQLSLTVTGEQVMDYDVAALEIPALEEGWPLQLVMKIDNQGNVAALPSKVEIEFWDKFKETKIDSTVIGDLSDAEPVGSFSEGEVIVSVEHGLEIGQYWAMVKVYEGTEMIYEDEVIFDVVALGSIDKNAELKNVRLSNNKPAEGELVEVFADVANVDAGHFVGKLMVKVMRDGKLDQMIEGEQFTLPAGSERTVSVILTPEKIGQYELDVFVAYAGKETPHEKLSFVIGLEGAATYVYGAVALAVVLILALIFILIKVMRKTKSVPVMKESMGEPMSKSKKAGKK
ncbi:hypothetical protein KJ611_04320 [Patescibacteria group bacterium]|nr:hypothetical protein [Patescibacteria group bacterium]